MEIPPYRQEMRQGAQTRNGGTAVARLGDGLTVSKGYGFNTAENADWVTIPFYRVIGNEQKPMVGGKQKAPKWFSPHRRQKITGEGKVWFPSNR